MRASAKTDLTRTPIVAVTANAMKGDAQKVLDAGCDCYLSKPVNIFELLEKVETLIARKI